MFMTLETDYAVRIVDYLAGIKDLRSGKGISEAMNIPMRFARNILQRLATQKIIVSHKGMNGGYKLTRKPEEISLYDVFIAMDEPTIMSRCLRND